MEIEICTGLSVCFEYGSSKNKASLIGTIERSSGSYSKQIVLGINKKLIFRYYHNDKLVDREIHVNAIKLLSRRMIIIYGY